jgi:hypothetical protein
MYENQFINIILVYIIFYRTVKADRDDREESQLRALTTHGSPDQDRCGYYSRFAGESA